MELTLQNRLEIIKYLKTTKALQHLDVNIIAKHLDRLIKYDQFEALEDHQGKMLYACAWWLLTDLALENYKKGIEPKRFNRGRNLVGFFFMNHALGVDGMLRVIRKNIKLFNAKTFSVYTSREKWLTYQIKEKKPRDRKKIKMAKEFIRLMDRSNLCLQQPS